MWARLTTIMHSLPSPSAFCVHACGIADDAHAHCVCFCVDFSRLRGLVTWRVQLADAGRYATLSADVMSLFRALEPSPQEAVRCVHLASLS